MQCAVIHYCQVTALLLEDHFWLLYPPPFMRVELSGGNVVKSPFESLEGRRVATSTEPASHLLGVRKQLSPQECVYAQR